MVYSIQQVKKLFDGECFFCGEDRYELLDSHRIIEGQDGGTYNWWNMLTTCALCHRKCHTDIIQILGKHKCMGGNKLEIIHYIEDGCREMEIVPIHIVMGTFKKFSEWLQEQEQEFASPMNALQQKRTNLAVSKSLSSMAPDQAVSAIKGSDPQAQKKLVSRSLRSPHVRGIDDIAPVVGIKTVPQMMRKK